MNIRDAARLTREAWIARSDALMPSAFRCEDGQSLGHQHWLLKQIEAGEVEGEKAHRWLGYAQGYLVALDALTLEDCKQANFHA